MSSPVDRVHQTQTTETNKPDPYPRIKDFEENIARYWQMVFGLRRMARETKSKRLKTKLNLMADLAIYEFEDVVATSWNAVLLSKEETEEDLPEIERVGRLRQKERKDKEAAAYLEEVRAAIRKAQADIGMQEGTV